MLQQVQPDLVLTQDTCAICDATAADVQRALDGIRPSPEVLILSPRTVSEILESITAVGTICSAQGAPRNGWRGRPSVTTTRKPW